MVSRLPLFAGAGGDGEVSSTEFTAPVVIPAGGWAGAEAGSCSGDTQEQ